MSLLIWGTMFEVKFAEIDAQHRRLFDLANQLSDAVRAGKGNEIMSKIVSELVNYTQTHFAYEEQLMAANHYPASQEHRQQHQDLIQKVSVIRQRVNANDPQVADEALQLFTKWLSQHIMETDKALAKALTKS